MAATASSITFDFDYYRFNGKGSRPTTVATPDQASFIRSRYSIEEGLVDLASQRVMRWAEDHGIALNARRPYPSSAAGRYWLEFHIGGLSL